MNLLPKSHKEFGEKDYWDKFFKKRGNKAFEWYGEYLELCTHLHKYIKLADNVLITGCGNSSLSADMYDVGFKNIVNIDVSEVVIKQMKCNNLKRENMQFLCMDATKMEFENDFFNVVLDKGTLDALMPDESDQTIEIIERYFSEIKRVLKFGGRFVCISLLQRHILKKVLNCFCDGCWMFRIVRCHDAEEKNSEDGDGKSFPVFVVVATKFKKLPQLILEVCLAGEKMQRLSGPSEMLACIKTVQDAAVVTNGLASVSLNKDEEVMLDLCSPGNEVPRYTLYIMDLLQKQTNKSYAVFIVPQGRESEWLFGTSPGRQQLLQSAGFSRLVVVILRRGQEYVNLEAVKEELSHSAKMLAPKGFVGQIPFLSIGTDVGSRVKVYEGTSKTTGDFVVEDVDVDGETSRKLIFLDNQFLVQSEARIKTVTVKGKPKTIVDFGHISYYHAYMSVGVKLSQIDGAAHRAAVLGLGGGSLCMFLRKCFCNLNLVAVDLDPVVFDIAKEHFQLKVDDKLKVEIKDGLDFLKEEAENGTQYDAILFDMDSKDRSMGLSCPPKQFLHDSVLKDISKILTNTGYFILNLVCRDAELHDSIMDTLKLNFNHILRIKLHEEVNEVVMASNEQAYSLETLGQASKSLNSLARKAKLVKIKCVDLQDIIQSATIIS